MIEGMSQRTFDENRAEIIAAITLLLGNTESRKRHQRLIVYEKATRHVLAQVLDTPLGPVVLHRGVEWSEVKGDLVAFRQARGRGGWIPNPLPAETDTPWLSQTFSRSNPPYDLSSDDLRRWIAEGRKEVILPE